jgi:hypothetical protein
VKLINNEKMGLIGWYLNKKVNLSKIGTKQTKGSCDRKNTFFSIRVLLFCFHKAEERLNVV